MDKKAFRKIWVDALRSGEYQQTTGALCSLSTEGDETVKGYCCLGVACDLYNKYFPTPLPTDEILEDAKILYDDMEDFAPKQVMEALGLATEEGRLYLPDSKESERPEKPLYNNTLADLNDSGKTFAEIADIIESEPYGLFKDED